MEDQANIKVFCRFRPLNDKENQISQGCCVNFLDDQTVSLAQTYENSEPLKFTFDAVFPPTGSQRTVYEKAAKPIVDAVMQGFNGTVFAYGQTSSGKTFTMTGPDLEDEELMGIIPRMVNTVFDQIFSADQTIEFSVRVSYCEIYLEKIKDLLDIHKTNLKIHEDRTRGVYIDGLSEYYVSNDREVYDLMTTGAENREVAYTNMNAGSSRSHSLFLLTVGQTNSKDFSGKTGKLYLIDLAGSEKISKTGAAGKRLEEAKNINKSLTVLGQVINSLTDGKSSHIPYRDSKLTRVLQDSLGGNSKTCLIVTCSPSPFNESETISTLRFGVRAKSIKNKPKVNREYTIGELKMMLAKLQEEIDKRDKIILKLEEKLKCLGQGTELSELENVQKEGLNLDYDEIIAEIEDLRMRLTEEVESNKRIIEESSNYKKESEELKADKDSLLFQTNSLQEKVLNYENVMKDQESLIEKLVLTKESLESDNEQVQKMKLSMEQLLNEKDLEISELKLFASGKQAPNNKIYDLRSQLESEKEKNIDLNKKLKDYQTTLDDTLKMIKYNNPDIKDKFVQQCVSREKKIWEDEKKSILKDLTNRINKVIELEIALDGAKEKYEALENTLSLGEKKLKKKCELLAKNLDQLTILYRQQLKEKSNTKVDGKLFERKIDRLNEGYQKLENENKYLKNALDEAEAKIKMIEEDNSLNSSRNMQNSYRSGRISVANIKKTIKGGAANTSRLSYVLE